MIAWPVTLLPPLTWTAIGWCPFSPMIPASPSSITLALDRGLFPPILTVGLALASTIEIRTIALSFPPVSERSPSPADQAAVHKPGVTVQVTIQSYRPCGSDEDAAARG
jgi:hypothetical protein